jgi:hypothetical protein
MNPSLTYTIKSKDESKPGIESAKQNLAGLNKDFASLKVGGEGLNMGMLKLGGILGAVAIGMKELGRMAGDCEAAFLKLNPEAAKLEGSAKKFMDAMTALKATFGAVLQPLLNSMRNDLINGILNPLAETIARIFGLSEKLKEMRQAIASGGEKSAAAQFMEAYSKAPLEIEKLGQQADIGLISAEDQAKKGMAAWEKVAQLYYELGLYNQEVSDEIREAWKDTMDTVRFIREKQGGGPVDRTYQEGRGLWGPGGPEIQATDWLTAMAGPANMVATAFKEAAMSVKTLKVLSEPLAVVFNRFFGVLAPVIDTILLPVIGGLAEIGRVIGEMVAPYLTILGGILKPIVDIIEVLWRGFEALAVVITWVGNVLADFGHNLFKAPWEPAQNTAGDLGEKLTGVFNRPVGTWATAGQNYMDIYGGGTGQSAGGGGGTAAYSARVVNIVVNAQGAFISDLRDFAILIRNEIESAEALGY